MANGVVKGQFIFGQNPVVGAVNSELVEKGLSRVPWLVVRDFALTETADFWREGRRVKKGEVRPEEIDTEVFFFPAAMPGEKEGTVTNTSRMVQWHDKVLKAPGDSRSDLWFVHQLGLRLKALYADSTLERDRPIQDLTWDYAVDEEGEPDAEAVLMEINGWTVADRKQLAGFTALKEDGSTACGGWAYSGIFPEVGRNLARGRRPDAPGEKTSHSGWAYVWPSNRRTMYNRASAKPDGTPWSERKKMIWWDEAAGKWTGFDVPDFVADKAPSYRPDWSSKPHGMDAIGGDQPFMLNADGLLQLFVTTGLKDGPLPTHYEPLGEPRLQPAVPTAGQPHGQALEAARQRDPRQRRPGLPLRVHHLPADGAALRGHPHPHHAAHRRAAAGGLRRGLARTGARELGIANLGWTVISSKRGEIEVKALVTERMKPFTINGGTVHQIGMPYVFGPKGYARGEIANVLLAIYGDANTSIHTTKALTVNLRAGRLAKRMAPAA